MSRTEIVMVYNPVCESGSRKATKQGDNEQESEHKRENTDGVFHVDILLKISFGIFTIFTLITKIW